MAMAMAMGMGIMITTNHSFHIKELKLPTFQTLTFLHRLHCIFEFVGTEVVCVPQMVVAPKFPGAAPGHFLGIFNSSNNGNLSNHIFAVEFDTVDGHNEKSDTDGNHIGININGMDSTASKSAAYYVEGTQNHEEQVLLEKEGPIQAWIDYDGVKKVVNVTVCPLGVAKPARPLLSEVIDLSLYLEKNMYAGFSAATGQKSSSHYILGWSFRLNGIADPLDLSQLPVVPVEKSSRSAVKVRKVLIATFSVVIFILLGALLCILFYQRVMKFELLEDWELDCLAGSGIRICTKQPRDLKKLRRLELEDLERFTRVFYQPLGLKLQ
ncbi:UNVERIFIED_CONTAM: L-type lectin-domain containing receptor kinase V.9 [Sesamum radiatum]|uniref:L-type lectin-domain containing receptor kinase V.9 n=1 Tax=Sesamum radiatum TaxID=300843 RepID=A0AAW2LBY1_SESRA